MRMEEAQEVAAGLRRRRLELAYSSHRYAAWLLARRVGLGRSARELKGSPHGRLLANPVVREVAARAGDGVLRREPLERVRSKGREVYRIGLSTWGSRNVRDWGSWYQTSRPGANLVMLLNFSARHNGVYRRWLDPEGALPAVWEDHPHARSPELTLAWARIDVDLACGEALIEEVQTDWLRQIEWLWSRTAQLRTEAARDRAVQRYFESRTASFAALERYWRRVLRHHRAWWAEATLFAALWVLVEELRIRRVYYHTAEGGVVRKRIRWRSPPRSLYTTLPARFGFELTREPPLLLRASGVKARTAGTGRDELPWYRLEL